MKITEITVNYSRKMWRDKFGTVGGDFGATATVEEGEDPADAHNALYEYVKQVAVRNLRESFDKMVEKPAQTPQEAPRTPQPTSGSNGAEYDEFPVETLSVEFTPSGDRRMKAKGGRWKKFGVTVWPEVAALEPLEWDLDTLDAADYPAPPGLTAKALMEDGSPKKVVEWI